MIDFNFKEEESDPSVPGNFYVSVIDDQKWTLVYGPFKTHREALENVTKAKDKAYQLDPKSFWYAWGTVKMKLSYDKPGILNKYLD